MLWRCSEGQSVSECQKIKMVDLTMAKCRALTGSVVKGLSQPNWLLVRIIILSYLLTYLLTYLK